MKPSRVSKSLFIVGLGLFIGLCWLIEAMIGPAVPRSRLRQIQPGMTKSEVRKLLGKPRGVEGDWQWEFARPLNVGWVEIWFDDQGCVTEINDESVFP
mgnify:CR=1 FL=1